MSFPNEEAFDSLVLEPESREPQPGVRACSFLEGGSPGRRDVIIEARYEGSPWRPRGWRSHGQSTWRFVLLAGPTARWSRASSSHSRNRDCPPTLPARRRILHDFVFGKRDKGCVSLGWNQARQGGIDDELGVRVHRMDHLQHLSSVSVTNSRLPCRQRQNTESEALTKRSVEDL